MLMGHGFVTPSALHYVRNHGPVPQLNWDEHKLTITGLVDRPRTFSMDEIAAMPQVHLPCLPGNFKQVTELLIVIDRSVCLVQCKWAACK